VKLVLFGDLHLDTPFKWAPAPVARRRRQALRDALDAIVDLALEVGADALCCAGDLYEHEMVAPDTGEVIRAAFERMGSVPVLVAPGNHDWLGPASVYARTAWSPNVHVFTSEELTPHRLADGFTVWGAAHCRPAGTAGFLDGFHVEGPGVHVGLFHASLRSGLAFQEEDKQPHAPFDAEQVPAAGLHHAMVGHYHTPADGDVHTYPGNPEPLSFGESGERGAVVLDVGDDGSVTRSRHSVARSTLHDLAVDITGCASGHEVRQRIEAALAGLAGTVRVTVAGEVEPGAQVDLAGIDEVAPHLDALVARLGRVTVAYDIDDIASHTGTVRGRFVRDVLDAADLDDDIRQRVLVTGLRALDGRTDLEVA
jgi:DNA repair protein SbcD/Mre11